MKVRAKGNVSDKLALITFPFPLGKNINFTPEACAVKLKGLLNALCILRVKQHKKPFSAFDILWLFIVNLPAEH